MIAKLWPSVWIETPGVVHLRSRDLRYAALVVLWEHGGQMRVPDLVEAIERRGFMISDGAASNKVLS